MEQTLFCSDCLQAMRNYSSDTGSPEARRRELPFWGIRQGKEVSIWAEFCVWRAALWQFFFVTLKGMLLSRILKLVLGHFHEKHAVRFEF